MEDKVNQQNDLGEEIIFMKDTISRLHRRVSFIENFIKVNHGGLPPSLQLDDTSPNCIVERGEGDSHRPSNVVEKNNCIRNWLEDGNGNFDTDPSLDKENNIIRDTSTISPDCLPVSAVLNSGNGSLNNAEIDARYKNAVEAKSLPCTPSLNEVIVNKCPIVPHSQLENVTGACPGINVLVNEVVQLSKNVPSFDINVTRSGSEASVTSVVKSEDSIGKISESSVKSVLVRQPKKELLVDVGLQTDLEEDPEVYYFAGGRHVSSQTDSNGEYEPLIPFAANTKLEIIVLTNSSNGSCSSTLSNASADVSSTVEEEKLLCVSNEVKEPVKDDINSKLEKDGWKTVTARSNRSKWSQSSSSLGSSAANSSRGSLDRGSVGDHRDGGSVYTGSNPGSLHGRLNSSGSAQPLRGYPRSAQAKSTHSQLKNQRDKTETIWKDTSNPRPFYNGNNTSHFLKSRFYQPSSTISLPVLNRSEDLDSKRSAPINRAIDKKPFGSKEKLNPKKTFLGSSLELNSKNKFPPPKPALQQRSTQTMKKPAAPVSSKQVKDKSTSTSRNPKTEAATVTKSAPSVPAKRNVPIKANVPITTATSKLVTKTEVRATERLSGSTTKRKLENPPASPLIATPRSVKSSITKTPDAMNTTTTSVAKKSNFSAIQSKVSSRAPVAGNKKKEKETQPSNDDKVLNILPDSVSSSMEGDIIVECSDKWKDHDAESSNDDEEIQQKEAALESAIQESEKLAEELLQVEKDFEEIESRGADSASVDEGSNVSECDTISSPTTFPESETETEMSDSCGDLDQFFFIAISDNSTLPIDESFDERIVAKKEKLRLSPSKKCDSAETLKRHRAKLAKAERNRELLLQSKYNQYVQLSEKFESLNETTKRLVEERYELMAKADERRKRAAEKRELHLRSIVKKAHDEDSKAKEIAFINFLEAQNKRHDYLANVQEVEDRLNSIQEERKLKFEDRAVKVQAVIERQCHIRRGWETKLAEMQEKRRKIDERIVREKEERAKERSELAQEKARDWEERISALNAAKQAEKEELQKKIQQKQEETARRHEENIEQIRQKAIELTLPRALDESGAVIVRMCTLCKVTIQSEVQELAHLRGRSHLEAVRKIQNSDNCSSSKMEQFGLKFITDVQVDKLEPGVQHDKNKSKKYCKKLMLKLISRGEEFEKQDKEKYEVRGDPTLKSRVVKNLRELERCLNLFSTGKGSLSIANSMDRLLADIRRTINKNKSVQDAVVSLGTFTVVSKILHCESLDLPPKILIGACNLIVGATYQHLVNGVYVIRSTVICSLLKLVVNRLSNLIPDGNRWLSGRTGSNDSLQADSVSDFAIETLFTILSIVPDPYDGISRQKDKLFTEADILDVTFRTQDIIGYLVSANVIDRLSVYCSGVQGPVDTQPEVANLLKISLDFLTALVWCLTFCLEKRSSINGGKRESDPTLLLAALESSELAGTISMSYALLLYQGAPPRPRLFTQSEAENVEHVEDADNTHSTVIPVEPRVPPPPGSRTASVVKSTLCLVNAVARLDIESLQSVLGSEAVSLQFRHIASQLLWQVVPHKEDRAMWGLLQELFIALGNFTVKNRQNQITIQSGQAPTVLQQLCSVAKEFLSDLKMSRNILPTLIAATHGCPENRELLAQESFPTDLLDGFLESKFSYANLILKRLVNNTSADGHKP